MNTTKPEKSTKRVIPSASITSPTVESQILEALSDIKQHHKITACNVFGRNWRVNVWLKEDSNEYLLGKWDIRYSFFVSTDEDGWIISSNPKLPSK